MHVPTRTFTWRPPQLKISQPSSPSLSGFIFFLAARLHAQDNSNGLTYLTTSFFYDCLFALQLSLFRQPQFCLAKRLHWYVQSHLNLGNSSTRIGLSGQHDETIHTLFPRNLSDLNNMHYHLISTYLHHCLEYTAVLDQC